MSKINKIHEQEIMKDLLSYGFDLEKRILHLDFEIEEDKIQNFCRAFRRMEDIDPKKAITVIINSPGGSVYEGLYLYDLLTTSPCPIIIEGYGKIMSMAAIVMCAGDARSLSPLSSVMLHEIYGGMEGSTTDITIEYKENLRLNNILIDIFCQKTKKNSRKYWKRIEKTSYLSPEEAVEIGLADEILTNR